MCNELDIYKNKTVLVTGHTGFKGSWLSIWLHELGAKVIGYALDPYTVRDNFVLSRIGEKLIDIREDIRNLNSVKKIFQEYKPDFVFHMAAQPLVRQSYEMPLETYESNVIGTINVLEAIRKSESTKVGIFITTDKCYENKEQIWGYRESDSLGGHDPYSSSKAAAEIAIDSWRKSFFNSLDYDKHGKSIASVRAGNVIGGGDWAKDRIIPDCIRAIDENKPIEIRNPSAIRPWQHVLDSLYGYLLLGVKMYKEPIKYAEAWNFGPNNNDIISVWEIASKLVDIYGKGALKDVSDPNALHEAKLLSLDTTKARMKLGWKPRLNIDDALKCTVDWYKNHGTVDIYQLCVDQINEYSYDRKSYE